MEKKQVFVRFSGSFFKHLMNMQILYATTASFELFTEYLHLSAPFGYSILTTTLKLVVIMLGCMDASTYGCQDDMDIYELAGNQP